MQIKSLNKLPVAAKNMFNAVYNNLVQQGKNEITSAKVALHIVKNNYKPVTNTKSVTLSQTHVHNDSDNYIDVLLGKPMVDIHNEYYAPEFWANKPLHPLKGDMEHINFQKGKGLRVEYPEEWEGFSPIADEFYHKEGELWAKVELPSKHPFTPTFKKDWESGKYGASVETEIPEEAVEYRWIDGKLTPTIISGSITGFTFTNEPAIDTKKKNE